jgi:putative oxidoreductase
MPADLARHIYTPLLRLQRTSGIRSNLPCFTAVRECQPFANKLSTTNRLLNQTVQLLHHAIKRETNHVTNLAAAHHISGHRYMAPTSRHRKEAMSTLVANVLNWRDVRAKFAPYAALPLRLIVGYGFLAHGLAKWSKGPEVFAGILQATGVPMPHLMAWLTIATEIVTGIAFLIGAFVPLVSIPAIILLAVAIFTVHLPYGFISIKLLSVNNGRAQFGPPGYECSLLYIASIVALALMGPTPWSIDKYRSSHHRSLKK